MIAYKAWANEATFGSVIKLPQAEVTKPRKTNFGNILHTLNHIYVVDDIFRHHLLAKKHDYTARNTQTSPSIDELWRKQQEMDNWYIDFAENTPEDELVETITFNFVDGDKGAMTREEILLHIVNHGSYHRGFVNDMFYQIPVIPPGNDFTVFLQK